MAITYTYDYPGVDVNLSNNSMIDLHWRCTGVDTDTGATAQAYGVIQHAATLDTTTRFYPDLTLAALDGWMTAYGNKPAIEASIASQINQLNNPTQEYRPPAA